MTSGLLFSWTGSMPLVPSSSYLYYRSNMSFWMVAIMFGAFYDVLIILLMFLTMEYRCMTLILFYYCSLLPPKSTAALTWLRCTDGSVQMSDPLLVMLFERMHF
uniref:Uncharacterized protein n=1 Tax=Triticum urartu TaxID=4572 RepID=A0A8R7TCS4_TRIUA